MADNVSAATAAPSGPVQMPTATVNPTESFNPAEFSDSGEVGDMKVVDTTTNTSTSLENHKREVKPADAAKPADKKPEAKVDEPAEDLNFDPKKTEVKEEEEVPEVVQTAEQKTAEQKKRNYEELPSEWRGVAKKCNNQEYSALLGMLKKLPELEEKAKGGLPPAYHEHPDAYTLTPEYSQASEQLNVLTGEGQHWKSQLLNIKQGKDWVDITGYDNNGRPLYKVMPAKKDSAGDPVVDHEAEMSVSEWFRIANTKAQSAAGAIRGLQNNFTAAHQQTLASVKKTVDQLFPHMVQENNPHASEIKRLTEAIPPHLRNSPLAELSAKAGAQCLIYQQQIKQLQDQLKQASGKSVMAAAAQPSSREILSGGASSANTGMLNPNMFDE